jgi:hypothetical protein
MGGCLRCFHSDDFDDSGEVKKDISNLHMGFAKCSAPGGVDDLPAMALQKRPAKANWPFIKVLIIKYMAHYRESTLKETGKRGHSFIISLNLVLATAICGTVLRVR